MGNESTRTASVANEPAGDAGDTPVAREQPARTSASSAARPGPGVRAGQPAQAGEQTFSEQQVAAILQRTAQLERGRAQTRPQLSLSEVEAIASEAGLDPSLVRLAAQSLEETRREHGLGTRLLGAPIKRTFERVIDGELSFAEHERIGAELRAAVRALGPNLLLPPQVASLGRSLATSVRTPRSVIDIEIIPRDGKTVVRIEANYGTLAGALFGALMGGLGSMAMTVSIVLAQKQGLGAVAAGLGATALFGGLYAIARGGFSWGANNGYRRMEKLADSIATSTRDAIARRQK